MEDKNGKYIVNGSVIDEDKIGIEFIKKQKNRRKNEKNIFITNIIMYYKFKCFNNERENSAGFVKNWGEAGNY